MWPPWSRSVLVLTSWGAQSHQTVRLVSTKKKIISDGKSNGDMCEVCHLKPFLLWLHYPLWLLNNAEGLFVSQDFRPAGLEAVLGRGRSCSCSEDFISQALR